MELLLSYGAEGDIGDSEEPNPIYKIDNKHPVKPILAHGADINVLDSYGQTLLHAMTYGASKEMVGTVQL
jgi:ankyrin repeat protein